MPVYQPNIWGDYKARVKPVGLRRFISSIPYLYGTQLKYYLTINNYSLEKVELHYNWVLRRLIDQHSIIVVQDRGNISVPAKGKNKQFLDVGYLTYTGDYIFDMRFAGQKQDQIMARFTLLDRDVYMVRWYLVLVGAVCGAGVTFAVTGC